MGASQGNPDKKSYEVKEILENSLGKIFKYDLSREEKSIEIGKNIGSSVVSGHVAGNVSSEVKDSFNTYSSEQRQSLVEAATEIQQLLEQLEKSYSTDTTAGRMAVATEAIKRIESNPTLMKKILSALKAGSVQAFEQVLNHPAASFVIGALEDWQKSKGS